MARIIRIGGSFVVVLVTYWAYALVAVPLIEPPADRHHRDGPTEAELQDRLQESKERWRRELAGLFAPGSWELESPTILELGQVRLLLQEYRRLDEGKRVEIDRCTIIFTPDEGGMVARRRRRRSIILQAPEGAVLEFERPFDPLDSHGSKFIRLDKGQLNGRITIRSGGKLPGPEDDLLVVTRDVDLNQERIFTPHAVDFRLGPNYGRGRQLWIKLLSDPSGETASKHGQNVDGIELVEIRQLERLHLRVGSEASTPGAGKPESGRTAPTGLELESGLPIEITCRGPFRFDPVEQVATFQDQVDVLRVHPEGPSDQLNCETLSVYFARPRHARPTRLEDESDHSQAKSATGRAGRWELYPRRIKASGSPAVVRVPSRKIDARGEQLEYDFQSGLMVLHGTQQVVFKQGPNEIHARRLQYQLAETGRLGQAVAEGPGWLRVGTDEKSARQLFARWGKLLHLRPHEGQPVLSLTGNAELSFGDLGRLTAREIHFYLLERPPANPGKHVQVRPDRMVALGQVVVDSPQLTAEVNQLGVWFEHVPASAVSAGQRGENVDPTDSRSPPESALGPSTRASQPRQTSSRRSFGPTAGPGPAGASLVSHPGQATTAQPEHHFEIVGRMLQARVLVRDQEQQLAELTIEGNVQLRETRTARPGEPPVVVGGELIHVLHAGRPYRAVTVTGNPPRFDGRGLTLSGLNPGSSIELDSGANELGIDTPGWMELPLDRDLEGRPLRQPGRLQVRWQKRMRFDGRMVRFEGAVVASLRQAEAKSELYTETLDVHLVHPIRFAQLQGQPDRPEVARIVCHGGALVENRSSDEHGQSSLDRFEVPNLEINLTSGETTADGPGWMTSVRRGLPDLLVGGAEDRRGNDPKRDAPAPSEEEDQEDNSLRYLSVRFQGRLVGNLRYQEVTFRDSVRCVYGPIDSWQSTLDPDDPDAIGPRGVLLTCEELSVGQMPLPAGDGRAVELAASGNVVVEGRTFTARAPRMTYTDAKQLLILEGDGRTNARLYYQQHVGAAWSEVTAGRILYWHSTGEFQFGRARSVKSS